MTINELVIGDLIQLNLEQDVGPYKVGEYYEITSNPYDYIIDDKPHFIAINATNITHKNSQEINKVVLVNEIINFNTLITKTKKSHMPEWF